MAAARSTHIETYVTLFLEYNNSLALFISKVLALIYAPEAWEMRAIVFPND